MHTTTHEDKVLFNHTGVRDKLYKNYWADNVLSGITRLVAM